MHHLVRRQLIVSTWAKILRILLFAVAMALSARVSVAVPFSPVPLTLQVLVVVLSGLVLGAGGGFAAQFLYLQAILLGAPVTATGLSGLMAFASPTAGYLWAFPMAAGLAGWFGHRSPHRKALWQTLGGITALMVIYALGMAWLSGFVGGMSGAWKAGVLPFVGADAVKVVLAIAIATARDRTRRRAGSDKDGSQRRPGRS